MKNLFKIYLCVAASPCLAVVTTPCEQAVMDFTKKVIRENPELRFVNGYKENTFSLSLSPDFKGWSYEDTEKLIDFIKERIGPIAALERVHSLSSISKTTLESFKKRVDFFDTHLGKEAVNEKMKVSFIPFVRGNVQEMGRFLKLLKEYVGHEEALQIMERYSHEFFNIRRAKSHRKIIKTLENYFEKEEVIEIIKRKFRFFLFLKEHKFHFVLQVLNQQLLNGEMTPDYQHKKQIAGIIKKHFSVFFLLNPDDFLDNVSFLNKKIGEARTTKLITENLRIFSKVNKDMLENQFLFAESRFTNKEIIDLIENSPNDFFKIDPKELNPILNAITKYFGPERTADIIRSNFKQLVHSSWKDLDETYVLNFLEAIPPKRIVIKRLRGMQGYIDFSNQYFYGSMRKAWEYAKSIVEPSRFRDLEWSYFSGYTTQFFDIRYSLYDRDTQKIYNKYKGMKGYVLFANEYFDGSMAAAFLYASGVLSKAVFKTLKWKIFSGSTEDFQSLRGVLFKKMGEGEIHERYLGMEGQAKLTEYFIDEQQNRASLEEILDEDASVEWSMIKTYSNVKAVLNEKEWEELGWRQFPGTVEEFREFSNLLLKNGRIKSQYIGIDGQIKFSIKYFEGNLSKAANQARTALDKTLYQQLKWKALTISASELKKLKRIINKKYLENDLTGSDAYVSLADEYFEGRMRKTYEIVSAIMTKEQFESLGWRKYDGSTSQYIKLSEIILDEYGQPRKQYIGQAGYIHFSMTYTSGNMSTAYSNVSIALGGSVMKKLGWKSFTGSVELFNNILENLFASNGRLNPEYRHLKGYKKFANEYFKGNMERTFKLVSAAVFHESIMEQLNCSIFKGTTSQLDKLFEDFKQNYPHNYQGMTGLNRVANEVFSGKTLAAYENVSVLKQHLFQSADSPQEAFNQLQWKR